MDQLVKEVLKRYAEANSASDIAGIGALYADTFLFAGPKGVQAVKKEDFLKAIPMIKDRFTAMGLRETQLGSFDSTALNSKYVLAQTGWTMTVRTPAGAMKQVDAFATYILWQKEDGMLVIVFQLDHQDLATLIKNLPE